MVDNILNLIPENITEEITTLLHTSDNIRIERIVSQGQTAPTEGWYDQNENEWVILLDGMAGITFEDSPEILLNKGDYLFIAAHRKHKVSFTSRKRKCIWLAIFFQ